MTFCFCGMCYLYRKLQEQVLADKVLQFGVGPFMYIGYILLQCGLHINFWSHCLYFLICHVHALQSHSSNNIEQEYTQPIPKQLFYFKKGI